MSETVVAALAPLPPAVWLRRRARELPFPLGEHGCRLFSRARHALNCALSALLEPGDEILAPAYHHGSEIEAFLRAGLVPRFYEATPSLAPDPAELEALATQRTRALHLVHYLGFPQDAERWRRWCGERGLLLVEDAAQAWLARDAGGPVGRHGDVAVFCLYKTFGLPDGAALLTRAPLDVSPAARGRGLLSLAMEHALWLSTRTRSLAWVSDHRPPRVVPAEEQFALGLPGEPVAATAAALPRIAEPRAAARRREHYRRYLELLPGVAPDAFARLPEGASPFVFPALAARKREALAALVRARVRALDLWSDPHPALPAERFPGAAGLRASVVGLPVHQELRPGDVERVARLARALL